MKKIGCETTSQALLGVHIIACNITNKIHSEKNWVWNDLSSPPDETNWVWNDLSSLLCVDYMHMAFIRVPDGLIWHKSPTSGPSRVATRARCWWRMPDEAIWYENEYHMHILARHHHKMHYISISYNFLTWLSNFQIAASTKMAYHRSLVLLIISLKLARKCQIMTNICCMYT